MNSAGQLSDMLAQQSMSGLQSLAAQQAAQFRQRNMNIGLGHLGGMSGGLGFEDYRSIPKGIDHDFKEYMLECDQAIKEGEQNESI